MFSPTGEVTEYERLVSRRETAIIDRGPLCVAMHDQNLLSGASAQAAAFGNWPEEFDPFLSGLSDVEQLRLKIAWADAVTVRYQNPFLQGAVLAYCGGDAEAASALLDALFGLSL
jgi:hypothetical protein